MLESMPLKSLILMALRYLEGKKPPSATNSYNMFDRCFAYPVKVGKGQAGYFGQSILAGSAWRRLRIYQNSTQKFWFMNAASKNKWWLLCVQDPSLCKQLAKHIWFIYPNWTCTVPLGYQEQEEEHIQHATQWLPKPSYDVHSKILARANYQIRINVEHLLVPGLHFACCAWH